MMTGTRIFTALIGCLAASSLAIAAPYDGSKALICATQSVSECVAGMDCAAVTPASVSVPDFFYVDAKNKTISSSLTAEGGQKTAIERSETLDGRLVLQGADDGLADIRDGVGWTMAIDNDTGKMALSAVGNGYTVIVFGACMQR